MPRRLSITTIALIAVGALGAAAWVAFGGGGTFGQGLSRAHVLPVLAGMAVTVGCVLIRFVRWQYLLRRVNLRVPARSSLRYFIASLAGRATPAYVGEAVRAVFLRKHHGLPARTTLLMIVVERLLDAAALAAIGAVAAREASWRWAFVLVAPLALIGAWALWMLAARRAPQGFAHALLLSVLAWLPVVALVPLCAAALDISVTLRDGAHVFVSATLAGAASLMPVGVVATGSVAVVEMGHLGIAGPDALAITTLLRIVTMGLSLVVGLAVLMVELRRLRSPAAAPAAHFDAIAESYEAVFHTEIFKLLLTRRIGQITSALPEPPAAAGLGLDIGAGLGWQARAMIERGYRVVGVEPAVELADKARARGVAVAAGSALQLPFADASFDFAYAVGVLHHVGDPVAQAAACREIARVLKPGGTFIVQETNTRNPLFRFYMGYVFPVLKTIDEGTEWWIPPDHWQTVPGFSLQNLRHFTFLPDMIPKPLMPMLLSIERRLENSRLRPYSVHYQVVLRRSAG